MSTPNVRADTSGSDVVKRSSTTSKVDRNSASNGRVNARSSGISVKTGTTRSSGELHGKTDLFQIGDELEKLIGLPFSVVCSSCLVALFFLVFSFYHVRTTAAVSSKL